VQPDNGEEELRGGRRWNRVPTYCAKYRVILSNCQSANGPFIIPTQLSLTPACSRRGFAFFPSFKLQASCPLPSEPDRSGGADAEETPSAQHEGTYACRKARRRDGVQRRRWRRQLVPGPHGRSLSRHPGSPQAR
jgi:hypothetical protein